MIKSNIVGTIQLFVDIIAVVGCRELDNFIKLIRIQQVDVTPNSEPMTFSLFEIISNIPNLILPFFFLPRRIRTGHKNAIVKLN